MADRYPFGQTVLLWAGVNGNPIRKMVNGSLLAADPSTIALTITQPDATTVNKTITDFVHDGTGLFHYEFLPTQSGFHTWRIVTTVPGLASEGSFWVAAIGQFAPVLDLQDFKNYLNLTANSSLGGDAELQAFLDMAVDLVTHHVGLILPTSGIVEKLHGGTPVVFTKSNILAVTSVVEWIGPTPYTLNLQDYTNNGPFSAYGYSVEGPKTIQRRTLGYPTSFFGGRGNIIVTYQAGFTTTPPAILGAIKELGKHLFKTQSGGRSNVAVDWNPSMAFSIPNRVLELLAEYDDNAGGMFA